MHVSKARATVRVRHARCAPSEPRVRLCCGSNSLPARIAARHAAAESVRGTPYDTAARLATRHAPNGCAGGVNSLQACFTLHELNHSHWAWVNEDRMPAGKEDSGIAPWREAPPIVNAVKDKARSDA